MPAEDAAREDEDDLPRMCSVSRSTSTVIFIPAQLLLLQTESFIGIEAMFVAPVV